MWGISLAEKLVAFREGLCFVELAEPKLKHASEFVEKMRFLDVICRKLIWNRLFPARIRYRVAVWGPTVFPVLHKILKQAVENVRLF